MYSRRYKASWSLGDLDFGFDTKEESRNWLHETMGPKIFSKKDFAIMIALYELTGAVYFDLASYNKVVDESIRKMKKLLNSKYGIYGRYKNKKQAKLLYKAYLKKLKKENNLILKNNRNVQINRKNLIKLVEASSKWNKFQLTGSLLKKTIIEKKVKLTFKQWQTGRITITRLQIEATKDKIKEYKENKKRINNQISILLSKLK